MTLKDNVDQLATDAALVHAWVNGTGTVTTAGGTVRSPAKLIADQDAAINTAAGGVLAQATTQAGNAATSAAAAATAQTAAQAARDAALGAQSVVTAAISSPISTFLRRISTSFTIPDGYNALTVGTIEADPSVTVMGLGDSTWRGI